ncbi:MAG: HepT-like ribonuclease domain-containing protein [Gaiellaceae bacterium]
MIRDRDSLLDILEQIELIQNHGPADESELEADVVQQAATLHWIQTIGEAAARISPELLARTPDVPWREIVDMRNLVVHSYDQVDLAIVWQVLERDLPALEPRIREILASLS